MLFNLHWFAVIAFLLPTCAWSEEALPPLFTQDPHRNDMGFFDLHLCNWPERPAFFKALFSTQQFAQVAKMEVLAPDGHSVGELSLDNFRSVHPAGKPEKRVFLNDLVVPSGSKDGWYSIRVTDKAGIVHTATDYVVMGRLLPATKLLPNTEDDIPLPQQLQWDAVSGAKHYQVFVRDEFANKLVFESKLLDKPQVAIPAEVLQADGYYSWVVHARDVNENVILGDFNSGSLSEKAFFSVRGE